MSKNCPNCAAPIDPDRIKCAYCGTTYLDFSTIDFVEKKPIYIKVRSKTYNTNASFVFKALPCDANIEVNSDTRCVKDGHGNIVHTIRSSYSGKVNICFDLLEDKDALYRVYLEEQK